MSCLHKFIDIILLYANIHILNLYILTPPSSLNGGIFKARKPPFLRAIFLPEFCDIDGRCALKCHTHG